MTEANPDPRIFVSIIVKHLEYKKKCARSKGSFPCYKLGDEVVGQYPGVILAVCSLFIG